MVRSYCRYTASFVQTEDAITIKHEVMFSPSIRSSFASSQNDFCNAKANASSTPSGHACNCRFSWTKLLSESIVGAPERCDEGRFADGAPDGSADGMLDGSSR